MERKKYNRHNFFKHTFCVFNQVDEETIKEFNSGYKSSSGSIYYFTENGLYRKSDHWGRAANCRWRIIQNLSLSATKSKIGYANWEDFFPNNEHENLYFINVCFVKKDVTFLHKYSKEYDGKSILRNASDTSKRIKIIKDLFNNEINLKYLNLENDEYLINNLIEDLTGTNLSFNEIKRKYM